MKAVQFYPPKTALVLALSLAGVFVMTGCSKSIKPESREPTKLVRLNQTLNLLTPVMSVNLPEAGGRSRAKPIKHDVADLQVARMGTQLLAASRTGMVSAIDGGKVVWSTPVGDVITSGVGTNDSIAVVGTRSGRIVAFDVTNGQILWQKTLPSISLSPMLVTTDKVLISTNDGMLHGLSTSTGESVWQFGTQNPAVSVRGMAIPIQIDSMTVLFATADGRIHAIEPSSGRPLWGRRIGRAVGGSQVHRMSDIDGAPLVHGSHLYVASYSGQLMGFDMSTGQELFETQFASSKMLTVLDDLVIGTSIDGDVVAFNRQTGEKVWENNELKYRKLTNPVTIGQYIYVGDFDGVIHGLDSTGKIVARYQAKGGGLTSLQFKDALLYTQSDSGVVSAWQPTH